MYKPVREDYFYGPFHMIFRKDCTDNQYGVTAWSIDRRWTIDIWLGNKFITLRVRGE